MANIIMGVSVGRSRGFFAEMQHQSQVAARQADQRQRAALREYEAANRRSEQARKAEQRAIVAMQRSSEADRKRFEREAAAAHVAAMQADVEQRNAALAAQYDEIDNLLAATLGVDDYVDLETLRRRVVHPDFDRRDLELPAPAPTPIPEPTEPVLRALVSPTGLFGRKKKLAEDQERAEAELADARRTWQYEIDRLPHRRAELLAVHAASEQSREIALEREHARYTKQCARRESEASEHNASVDQLIADLGYGTVDAVREYVGIVLAHSVYPGEFQIEHDADFEPTTAELRLRILIPGPDRVPTIKGYKYTKATDEITTVASSQKDAKDRYAGAVHQVALRTLHEIFEADRRGLIQTISLELGTETVNPATGNQTYVPFVAVGADRTAFSELDLSAVVPAATLEHLGAAVSKNPFGLVAASGAGIRRS